MAAYQGRSVVRVKELRQALVWFCLAPLVAAQTPAAFDAVSIHLNNSGLGVSREPNSPGRLALENTTVSRLIQLAYGVQRRNIIGPDWLSSDRYDVTRDRGGALDADADAAHAARRPARSNAHSLRYGRHTRRGWGVDERRLLNSSCLHLHGFS
jgi:hypothetical protein